MMEAGEDVVVEIRCKAAGIAADALGADQELRPFGEIDAIEHEIAGRVELSDGRKADGRRDEGDHRAAGGPEGTAYNPAQGLRVFFSEARHFGHAVQDIREFIICPAVGQHHGVHVSDTLGQRTLRIEEALRLLHERGELAAQVPPRHKVVALAAVRGIAVVCHRHRPVAFRQVDHCRDFLAGTVFGLVERQRSRCLVRKDEESTLGIDRAVVVDQREVIDAGCQQRIRNTEAPGLLGIGQPHVDAVPVVNDNKSRIGQDQSLIEESRFDAVVPHGHTDGDTGLHRQGQFGFSHHEVAVIVTGV